MPKSPLYNLYYPFGILVFTSIVGCLGFRWIEGYNWVDAVYMTVITMSTVGFGTVKALSSAGKLFAVFLIISSAGTFLYVISTLTTLIIEGEVRQLFNKFRVSKQVSKLKDHVVLCGLGRNGREAATELLRQQHKFVIIEMDEDVIADFLAHYPQALFIQGDATQDETLALANIHDAKGLISTLSSDAENVFIALTAREMCPKLNIVARASVEASIPKLKRAGADKVILPNIIGGTKMVNLILRPALVEFMDMVTGEGDLDLHIEDMVVKDFPKLIEKSISELDIRSRTGAFVIGYQRGNSPIELRPDPNRPIAREDRMFILGTDAEIRSFKETFIR